MSISVHVSDTEQTASASAGCITLDSLSRIRILRFALGVTAAASIAFAVRWPLFFLAPALVAFFLAHPAAISPTHQAGGLLVASIMAVVLGLLFGHILLPWPIIYIPLIGLALFHIYYWVNRGGSPILAVILLLAVMILPVLSLSSDSLASGFFLSLNFLVSAGLAVVTWLAAHIALPEPSESDGRTSAGPSSPGYSPRAAIAALKSTLVVLPIAILFLAFSWESELLLIVFVAIFSLSPEVTKSRAKSQTILAANLIGIMATVVFYWLIVAVPEYHFFVALMFLTALAFGRAIFAIGPLARYMPPACIAVLILIGASMTPHAGFMEQPFKRILLISLAAFYVVAALDLMNLLFPPKKGVRT